MPHRAAARQTKRSTCPAQGRRQAPAVGSPRRRRARVRAARLSQRHHPDRSPTCWDPAGEPLYYCSVPRRSRSRPSACRASKTFTERAQTIASGAGGAAEKIAALVRAHLMPLLDTADYIHVCLRPAPIPAAREPAARIAKWSHGIERVIAEVIEAGSSRRLWPDIDPARHSGILGMFDAVSAWYGKENASLERIPANASSLRSAPGKPRGARALDAEPAACRRLHDQRLGSDQIGIRSGAAGPRSVVIPARSARARDCLVLDPNRINRVTRSRPRRWRNRDLATALVLEVRAPLAHADQACDDARKGRRLDAGQGRRGRCAAARPCSERHQDAPHGDA